MATGTHPNQLIEDPLRNLFLHAPRVNPSELSSREGLNDGEGVPNPGHFQGGQPRMSRHVPLTDVGTVTNITVDGQLLQENLFLREKVRKLQSVLQNSKLETADLYVKFGEFAKDWAETVKRLNILSENQRKDYEARIGALEKTNEQLLSENNRMKKVIEDLNKMKSEFEKQKRKLRLGQIGFQLDILVSEYVFPGDDKASKRARYGTKLKSLKGKIDKMHDERMKQGAKRRIQNLDKEMFEDWFLGMVDDMKKVRVDTAHPDLGTYEEMQQVINDEFGEDDDKRNDLLVVLEHLNQMYKLLNRRFGE